MSGSQCQWVTNPSDYREIKLSSTGYGARKPLTIIDVLKRTVEKHGREKALGLKRPVNGVIPENWKFWTWNDYWNDSLKFAKSLLSLQVPSYGIVNILGFNSPEWIIANSGSIVAGCISAGIYSTNTPDACHYITEHSKAEVVVLEGNKQLEKYTKMKKGLPALKAIVVWAETPDPKLVAKVKAKVYTWEEFMEIGSNISNDAIDQRGAKIRPGNCASLIYTSGTTGPPKAVMISHDNVTWTSHNIVEFYMDLNCTDRVISYLPLSHIAAQIIDIYAIMDIGACCYFCQTDALKGSLTTTMKEVRPTIFFAVPRVWEKIQEKMVEVGRSTKGVKKVLSTWAKSMGAEHMRRAQYGNGGGAPCTYSCANLLVLSKIKQALGLDKAKGCFTAAAPIAAETLNYFASLDIPVYEVFGQSECTGPHTVSYEGCWKVGSCGRPIKGSESMNAEGSNELCYRGRHIFMGYMYMSEKTAETIDEDGWLHSGDVATFDDDHDLEIVGPSGFMHITGRIKELIITAGGENVPPVLIENEMKAEMVAISNVMVIGDKRKYLTMLVSLKVVPDSDSAPTDKLAQDSLFVAAQIGSTAKTYSEAKKCPKFSEYMTAGMKRANAKTTSNAQVVQKFAWLPIDFSENAGDLTPTLKLKRSVVASKYHDLIESLY